MSPKKILRSLRHAPSLYRELAELRRQAALSTHRFPIAKINPYTTDKRQQSGTARGHYFHQDLLVARRIFLNKPDKHVDIGSRIDGFVAHVASYREIEVLDIRPLALNIPNIRFKQADLISLPPGMAGYCDSLSCLHAIEHFGLGRYGDPIDFQGHLKGLDSMHAILKPGGTFYLSCPIGPQRIEFNAHRVFSIAYLLELFKDRFKLRSFSYVDDAGDLHEDVPLTPELIQGNCGCRYGCGIFEMDRS